jgi:hypothetical protein
MLTSALANGNLDTGDRTYLAKLIAARTGISQQDAEKRIEDAVTQMKKAEEKAKQVADAARKASASASFYLFVSMLIGAFIASAAGAVGGRQRDDGKAGPGNATRLSVTKSPENRLNAEAIVNAGDARNAWLRHARPRISARPSRAR